MYFLISASHSVGFSAVNTSEVYLYCGLTPLTGHYSGSQGLLRSASIGVEMVGEFQLGIKSWAVRLRSCENNRCLTANLAYQTLDMLCGESGRCFDYVSNLSGFFTLQT